MITFFEQIVSAFKFIRIQDYIDIFGCCLLHLSGHKAC